MRYFLLLLPIFLFAFLQKTTLPLEEKKLNYSIVKVYGNLKEKTTYLDINVFSLEDRIYYKLLGDYLAYSYCKAQKEENPFFDDVNLRVEFHFYYDGLKVFNKFFSFEDCKKEYLKYKDLEEFLDNKYKNKDILPITFKQIKHPPKTLKQIKNYKFPVVDKSKYPQILNERFWGLQIYKNKVYFTDSDNLIKRFDLKNEKIDKIYDVFAYGIFLIKDDYLISAVKGVDIVNLKTNKKIHLPLRDLKFSRVYKCGKNIYIVSDYYLIKYDLNSRKLEAYKFQKPIEFYRAYIVKDTLFVNKDGNLIVVDLKIFKTKILNNAKLLALNENYLLLKKDKYYLYSLNLKPIKEIHFKLKPKNLMLDKENIYVFGKLKAEILDLKNNKSVIKSIKPFSRFSFDKNYIVFADENRLYLYDKNLNFIKTLSINYQFVPKVEFLNNDYVIANKNKIFTKEEKNVKDLLSFAIVNKKVAYIDEDLNIHIDNKIIKTAFSVIDELEFFDFKDGYFYLAVNESLYALKDKLKEIKEILTAYKFKNYLMTSNGEIYEIKKEKLIPLGVNAKKYYFFERFKIKILDNDLFEVNSKIFNYPINYKKSKIIFITPNIFAYNYKNYLLLGNGHIIVKIRVTNKYNEILDLKEKNGIVYVLLKDKLVKLNFYEKNGKIIKSLKGEK